MLNKLQNVPPISLNNQKEATKENKNVIYLNVTSGTGHLTPLWKGCRKEMVWLDWSTDDTSP